LSTIVYTVLIGGGAHVATAISMYRPVEMEIKKCGCKFHTCSYCGSHTSNRVFIHPRLLPKDCVDHMEIKPQDLIFKPQKNTIGAREEYRRAVKKATPTIEELSNIKK
jgi:hypothetical protein